MTRIIALLWAALVAAPAAAEPLNIIPWPREVRPAAGALELTGATRIVARDDALRPLAAILGDELFRVTGRRWAAAAGAARDGDIVLELDSRLAAEEYTLTVDRRATVRGGDYAAAAMGTATLLQALDSGARATLPRMTVRDRPHFAYRGAMLDVARKPHSLATLRQCVEVCRFYKIRHLHLHLTDENAWTFPSTAFPKLGSLNFAWAGGEKPKVYPLADLKELVAFADARGVTLVPEMEVPGHSGHLRGTYPELFGYRDAAGKTVTPGVVNMVREESLAALDTLVGELAAVFRSSPYIHLGCDEASIAEVAELPEVKAFAATHKLAGVGDVFNLFVNRLHAMARKHGKRLILWEGAPLGPVAPPKDLIVMPWVGGGGTAAELVRRGYGVINPPWGVKTPYIDPYLVNGAQLRRGEPLLLGATSILWESVEELAVPYLRHTGALRNEPVHNPDSGRDHADFLRRLKFTDARLDRLLHGFAFNGRELLDPLIFMRGDALFADAVTLSLQTSGDPGTVRVTTDGTEPTAGSPRYAGPITLRRTATLKARRFGEDGKPAGPTFVRDYQRVAAVKHDAVGAKVTIRPEQPGYAGAGAKGLTDGYLAAGDEAGSPGWVGWEGRATKIEIIIDPGREIEVKRISAHFLRAAGGINLPRRVEFAISDDGTTFRPLTAIEERAGLAGYGWYSAEVAAVKCRYLRVSPTPGGDWTFIDEVAVNAAPRQAVVRHAALGKPVMVRFPFSTAYDAAGVAGLTDGVTARSADFVNLPWLGIEGRNLEATIDLGVPTEAREVRANFLQYVQAGIHIPSTVEVFVSDDGKEFRKAATATRKQDERPKYIQTIAIPLERVKARHVRLVAHNNGQWIFCDEVMVNPE